MNINRKTIHSPDIPKWFGLMFFSILAAVSGQLRAATEVSSPERISVAYCTDCVPFHFRDAQGQPAGMIVELWRLWSEKTGVVIDFHPASWTDSLQRVTDGRSQVHAGLFFNEQRDRYLDYGAVLANTDTHVFLHHTLPLIERVEDLAGYRTGVLAGDYVEDHLQQRLPENAIVPYPNYGKILKDLSAGKLKAFAADTPTGIYHLKHEDLLKQFKISDSHLLYSNDWRLAVAQGNLELLEMLNQGMAKISAEEHAVIAKRWTDAEASADKALITANSQTPSGTSPQTLEENNNETGQVISAGKLALWFFTALAAVLVVLLVILKRLRGEATNRIFTGRNLSYIVMVLVTTFLTVVLLVAWFALERMDRQLRLELADTLEAVNQSVAESLDMWLENRSREIQHLARDRELLPLTQQLLALPREADIIRDSQMLERMRALYRYHMSEINAKGFFIIAPDYISIGSMRDTNIGSLNLIAERQPELMKRAFSGETVFIPPIYSDVPLKDVSGRIVERAATMFFATPLYDPSGTVIAVLTLRFDPVSEFGRMTHAGQMGASGETYAFDRQARLLTESRLDDQLAILTEVFTAENRLLSMRISDPGGNLLEDYQPVSEQSQWPLTRMASEALKESDGLDITGYRDYRGVPVIGTWSWLDRLGIGLATEMDLAEALKSYHAMRQLVLSALGGIVFIALLLTALTVWLGERARSRLQLLVSERTEELRKVVQAVEQSPLCVVITDLAGNIEHVNPTFTTMTGYEASEVIGKNPRVLKSGETPPEQYATLWETILAGKVWHSEIRNRRKNGELYWGSISIAPVHNDAGEVTHFIAMTEDITETKKVELALHDLEYTRNLALDAAQVGLWSGDIVTDNWTWDGRVNRMMGFPEDMAPDLEKWVGALHPDDREKVLEDFQAAIRGEQVYDVEYRVVWPDGSVRFITARGKTTLDDAGKPIRIDGITYDVTDLRTAQSAMLEAQERNKLILESAGEGVFGLDIEGCVTFCNQAASNMLGYGVDELLGISMHKAVHYAHADGSDYAEADCAMAAAFHDGEVRQISDEVLWRKDGTAFPVEYSATPISSDEELVGAVVVFRDITERQLAEAKLNASMQRFKVLFDEAADAYLIFDGTGFADCNQAAVDLLGYSHKQELLACHPAEFSPELQPGGERSDEKAEAMIAAAYSQGGNRFDWIHRKKGGEEIPVEVTLTPIELDGKPVLLTVWHDLTERQKAEEEIKRINFLSDIALELTGSGYWHVDYSDPDYYYQSERAANILGEPLKDDSRYHLQDEWFSRLMEANPKTAETTAERYQGAIDGKYTSYDSTYAYRRPLDGKIVWVHAAGKIVRDESDKIRYMYGAYQDITEPHRVQRELNVAKEAADAANQAKSAFLANMSHELRTPMNAILGYSEMLMEDAEDAEQDEFIPDLKKINQAGNHLLSLINDVLDLSKIESGKMEAFAEQFDVGALIDQAFDTAQPLMEKKNNHFKIERGDNLGYAYQDITKLRQSLLNMLSNAAKFTHAGTITLWAERKSHANADWLSFSVSDTGIGIPADKLDHVFEEFSQADTSTTRDYGGTGLGLAISRRFCRMLGGDLTVASQVGAGSTFTIQLPAVLPGAEAPQEEAPQPNTEDVKASSDVNEAPSGRTILVIDDDAEASEIIRRFLEKDGYNVVTAISGEAGLRLAHQLKPAAITLDVMMPDMDGWSVLRALKVDPVLQDIPVVMLSMIDDKSKGFALGATDYLTKPVDREQLHNALARHYTPGEPSSVLLVEDDQPTREMMARTLEKTDWDVSEAGNGREALEQLARQKPRLILLDLMMPVMDGFDFLLEMRAKAEWQDIPVIVLTAKDLSGEDRNLLSGRVEEVLEKNAYTREQLLERVSQAVTACSINQAEANDTGMNDELDTVG